MEGYGSHAGAMASEVLRALEALKKALKEIESNPESSADDGGFNSASIKVLLELQAGSADLLSGDPNLSSLSQLLFQLKELALSFKSKRDGIHGIRGFLWRRSSGQELARVAGAIGSELQSWIDRENADRLVSMLRSSTAKEEEKVSLLSVLEERVSQGFDRALQDALLRSGVYGAVERALADLGAAKPVRERAAGAVLALVRFNKAVFAGPMLMGPAVRALVAMGSAPAMRALCGLVASIRSPLIDELIAKGEVPKIIALLSSSDVESRALALECVLEIGYYGRKEAIDAMLEGGLIKRLVALQRSDLGGALIEMDGGAQAEVRAGVLGKPAKRRCKERQYLETRPFASCVARFAIQIEVGEGLRQREKRAFKQEVLRRVREAVSSDAEASTVLAEVLWGSTSW